VTGGTVVAIVACIVTVMINLIIVAFFAGKVTARLTQLEADNVLIRASLHDLRNALTAFMLGTTIPPDDANGTNLTQLVTQWMVTKQQKMKAASTTA
jgi:hypothetical protein